MSILQAFERLLNPRRAEAEDREQRAVTAPRKADAGGPPPRRCRACAYEGDEQYCPRCLADTMKPVRRPRG
jgi:hypothetical protein